jgi:glyoxylase-like metal-dependent hydrolase (beta-lactamase superfamily II)
MMRGPGTNTYLVGDGPLIVIDPGHEDAAHRSAVIAAIRGRTVSAVAVTHHHGDHAPGARALADALGAPVVGYGHPTFDVDVAAREGTVLDGGSCPLTAWHTPGHASDHVCWFAPSLGWLFTGDHLMEGSTVVIPPPDGDLTTYLETVARVRDDTRVTMLAPGHGRLIDAPAAVASDVLDHRARRAALVLGALAAHGPSTPGDLRPSVYLDIEAERHRVATLATWAHLLALVDSGDATLEGSRDDPEAVFTASP